MPGMIFIKKIGFFLILVSFAITAPLTGLAQKSPNQAPKNETDQEKIYIPKNLDECYAELTKMLSKEEVEKFKNKDEDKATADAHFGLGMWLRNNWGLWQKSRLAKYFNGMGIFHPDDMSGIILTSFHRHLNNKDIELNKQIKYYQDYWEKIKKEKERSRHE